MKTLIRQLVREINFSKKKSSGGLKWKFDPNVLNRDLCDWERVWSGVERIGGYFFLIGCDVFPILARGKAEFHFYVKPIFNGKLDKNVTWAELNLKVNNKMTENDVKTLQSVGDQLRKIVIERIEHNSSQIETRAQFFDSLPPWRPGVWSVPSEDPAKTLIVGDRLDMGHYQIVIAKNPMPQPTGGPKHPVVLVCRKNLDLQGPRQAWLISKNSSFDEARDAAEAFINVEKTRLDPENDQGRAECYDNLVSMSSKGWSSRW